MDPHKHWHSRGYLPHCDTPGLIQSITFRLNDSLPKATLQRLMEQGSRASRAQTTDHIEALLAANHGECWLKRPEIAAIVENALLHFDGQRYRLLAWCVMPNHVHALIETHEGQPLGDVVHGWKSFTAKAINRQFGRTGAVWHPDFFDRYVRDDAHLRVCIDYIENNPVVAGLVARVDAWKWSSASRERASARDARGPW